jgi:hypothetical protein
MERVPSSYSLSRSIVIKKVVLSAALLNAIAGALATPSRRKARSAWGSQSFLNGAERGVH